MSNLGFISSRARDDDVVKERTRVVKRQPRARAKSDARGDVPRVATRDAVSHASSPDRPPSLDNVDVRDFLVTFEKSHVQNLQTIMDFSSRIASVEHQIHSLWRAVNKYNVDYSDDDDNSPPTSARVHPIPAVAMDGGNEPPPPSVFPCKSGRDSFEVAAPAVVEPSSPTLHPHSPPPLCPLPLRPPPLPPSALLPQPPTLLPPTPARSARATFATPIDQGVEPAVRPDEAPDTLSAFLSELRCKMLTKKKIYDELANDHYTSLHGEKDV